MSKYSDKVKRRREMAANEAMGGFVEHPAHGGEARDYTLAPRDRARGVKSADEAARYAELRRMDAELKTDLEGVKAAIAAIADRLGRARETLARGNYRDHFQAVRGRVLAGGQKIDAAIVRVEKNLEAEAWVNHGERAMGNAAVGDATAPRDKE